MDEKNKHEEGKVDEVEENKSMPEKKKKEEKKSNQPNDFQ